MPRQPSQASGGRPCPKSRHTPGQTVLPGMSAIEPGKKERDDFEFQEQQELIAFLRRFKKRYSGLRWTHSIPNGLYLFGKVARDAVATGMTAGVWDLFVPCCRGGAPGLYVEMKWGENGLTTEQKEFREHLDQEGYRHAVAYHWIDGVSLILDYLEIHDREIDEQLDINRKATVEYATPPRGEYWRRLTQEGKGGAS